MKKHLLALAVIGAFIVYAVTKKGMPSSTVPPLQAPDQTAGTDAAGDASVAYAANVPFKDGKYTGQQADAFYGMVQVQVTIKKKKLTDVQFLQYPKDRSTSLFISTQAMPILKSEAIRSQKAPVQIVSGATEISKAFNKSLSSALSLARK